MDDDKNRVDKEDNCCAGGAANECACNSGASLNNEASGNGNGGYNPWQIEVKWQGIWRDNETYVVTEDPSKPKFYLLEMFPYPSGELHVGHVRNYTIGDVISRYKRARGYNVLHPMGWDSFGLPAENAAIDRGIQPDTWTWNNIAHMREQLKRMGFTYDWSREVTTAFPEYYKWTQWLFLLLYERGLAYKKTAPANWCPKCHTVLANEQVEQGKCWRCDSLVERRSMDQWFFKITDYAERLLADLEKLDGWPEHIKIMQANWIGKSEGAEIDFAGPDGEKIPVFTTRQDTIYGVTYLVLAPEHPLVEKIIQGTEYEAPVRAFIDKVMRMSEIDRTAETLEKEGIFTGAYATNPVSGDQVPIWIGNYVIYEYGTGAVMGVPGHDERDFHFARKYGLPIKIVIQNEDKSLRLEEMENAYVDPGIMVDSGKFTGLGSEEGQAEVTRFLEENGMGRGKVTYKMRDWLISRQRYWGAPIPVIYCPKCGTVPVPKEDLPVILPLGLKVTSGGPSPLARHEEFVNTTCPVCGEGARRETDTMDTFVCSSWYFFRFASPYNTDVAFAKEDVDYWSPVDLYIGGVEHAVMHLLYARFITKVLYDAGLVPAEEPFQNLLTQGMVVRDGAKMSKSKGNVVSPDEIVGKFGADVMRVFMMFAAPPERDLEWSDRGVEGANRFLRRVWRQVTGEHTGEQPGAEGAPGGGVSTEGLLRIAHQSIKKVSEDLERLALNTAVSQLMELSNYIGRYQRLPKDSQSADALEEAKTALLKLLSPFAPHMAQELWEKLGYSGTIEEAGWPEYDQATIAEKTVTVVVQVNGKVRDRIQIEAGSSDEEVTDRALASERIVKLLGEGPDARDKIAKVVVVKDKLVNIVTKR
ncbi:MAG: leucine--tRNA ligase [Bacillota bacterium]|jgi:leucyl-tRNA synthetase